MKIRVRNKKLVFAVLALMIACTLVATGAILTQYGRVETTINARQSVLLDGQGINSMPITNELGEMIGGDPPECFKHTLWNRGAQDSNILIETSITDTDGSWINSDGVYVDYYDLSPELFISGEVTDKHGTYTTTDYYDNNLLVEINHLENCDIEYVVTTPTALEDGSQDNFAIAFDVNNNYDADFQVSFHSNKDDHHPGTYWGYQVVEDGSWGDWQALPSWIEIDNVGRHVFTIAFSSDEIGGIGSDYRFGVSGSICSDQINSGENVNFKYPLDFSWGTDWITSEDYKWQPMGTELGSSFTLQSGEELLFAICYSLHQDIEPADYLVKTKFVPNNSIE